MSSASRIIPIILKITNGYFIVKVKTILVLLKITKYGLGNCILSVFFAHFIIIIYKSIGFIGYMFFPVDKFSNLQHCVAKSVVQHI